MSEPLRRSLPAATIAWAALALTLCHLCLVYLDGAVALAAPLRALRTALSLPVLFVPGLPLALWFQARTSRSEAEGKGFVGVFTLLSIALGLSLVLDFCVAEVVRSIAPPVSGRLFSLTALAGAGALLLSGRLHQLRIGLERGLTPWLLILAMALVLGFAFAARGRLFHGLERYVLIPKAAQQAVEREGLRDPGSFEITLISGASPHREGWHHATGNEVRVKLTNPRSRTEPSLVGFAIIAPLGTGVRLGRLDGAACDARGAVQPLRWLAATRVPEEVLNLKLSPVFTDFNTVIAAPVELPPGDTCLLLRFKQRAAAPARRVIFAEVSHDLHRNAPLLGGRLQPVPEATIETHMSGVHYRAALEQKNEIAADMLLWGYFTQMVMEQLAGDKGSAQGATFLLFCLLAFTAALVIIGAASAATRAAAVKTRHSLIVGLLLLGPLFSQIYSQTFVTYRSFAFPDTVFTFFIVSAIAMLVLRNRVGFILLGCLGAFARYPGAYVLVVALIARLVFYKQDRAWTRRTLVWAAGAGLLVVALLLAHFSSTIGVKAFAYAAYFEVFPEHFQVFKQADPAWLRVTCFFSTLALLSGLTILLWPLVREAASKLLIAVTLGYAITLMAVHVPHMHYFPILVYCTAAAGLRAVALRGRLLPTALAVVLVTVGTVLAVQVEPLLRICIGCFTR